MGLVSSIKQRWLTVAKLWRNTNSPAGSFADLDADSLQLSGVELLQDALLADAKCEGRGFQGEPMRDGRVLVAGGYQGKKPDPLIGAVDPEHFTFENFTHSDFEIFSPDYLFAGARPEITGIVGGGNTITYTQGSNSTFEIKVARPGSNAQAQDIGSVCLISPGSVTHHYGWDQRYVGLHFAASATSPNTKLVITPPANGFVAPPGWYLLFINTNPAVTTVKIPSIAMFVKLQ